MPTIDEQKNARGREMADGIRSWVMVALTGVFVALYVLSLLGCLRPLADYSVVARLEPIIFVIIGYYFGRLPARQNEQILRAEIDRKTQQAGDAQSAAGLAQQEGAALKEKIKNTAMTLEMAVPGALENSLAATLSKGIGAGDEAAVRQSAISALKILRS